MYKLKAKFIPILIMATLFLSVATIGAVKATKVTKEKNSNTILHDFEKNDKFKILDESNDTDDGGGDDGGDDNNGGDDGGDSNNGTEEDNGEEEEYEHDEDNETVGWEEHSDEFRIVSNDNVIQFKKDKPEVSYEYFYTENNTTIEASLEVRGNKIIEFSDNNSNGIIDEGEILYTFELEEEGNWMADFTVENMTINGTNTSVIIISYYYQNDQANITIKYYVYTNSAGVVDGGADKIKSELIISNWSWHSPNSTLALELKTEVSLEKETFTSMLNGSLGYDNQGVFIFLNNKSLIQFSWNTTAVADGVLKNITNSYWTHYENETEMEEGEIEVELEIRSIIVLPEFTNELYYDPIIGVEDNPNDVFKILQATEPVTDIPTGGTGGGTDGGTGGDTGTGDGNVFINLPVIGSLFASNALIGLLAGFILVLIAIVYRENGRRKYRNQLASFKK